jgi:hypothetical protein
MIPTFEQGRDYGTDPLQALEDIGAFWIQLPPGFFPYDEVYGQLEDIFAIPEPYSGCLIGKTLFATEEANLERQRREKLHLLTDEAFVQYSEVLPQVDDNIANNPDLKTYVNALDHLEQESITMVSGLGVATSLTQIAVYRYDKNEAGRVLFSEHNHEWATLFYAASKPGLEVQLKNGECIDGPLDPDIALVLGKRVDHQVVAKLNQQARYATAVLLSN